MDQKMTTSKRGRIQWRIQRWRTQEWRTPGGIPPIADHDQEEIPADNEEVPVDNIEQVTEHDCFESAEAEGHARAQMHNNIRPRRTIKNNRDKDFVYPMMKMMIASFPASNLETGLSDDTLSFVTAQMSAKAGLKYFGSRRSEAIVNELRQLILLKVMTGCLPSDLTAEQKAKSLKYLMFLKEKRSGKIKGGVVQTDENREFTRLWPKPARQL
jgi:hypothetical protein